MRPLPHASRWFAVTAFLLALAPPRAPAHPPADKPFPLLVPNLTFRAPAATLYTPDARPLLACLRGLAHLERLELDDGLAAAETAVKLAPKNAGALVLRAWGLLSRGKTAAAIADCDQALKLDPDCAPALAVRGWARALKGQGKEALADCDAALKLEQSARLYALRGRTYLALKQHPKGIADLGAALKLDPHYAAAHYS